MDDITTVERIARKVESLPPVKRLEVEDFVDFLRMRLFDGELTVSAVLASEPALAQLWDNADDAEYDWL